MLQEGQTNLGQGLSLTGNLNDMVTKRSFNNIHSTHRIVHHELVESGNHSAIGKPIQVTALFFRTWVGGVNAGQFGKHALILGVGLQFLQQTFSLCFGLVLGDSVLAIVGTLIGNQNVACSQGVGAVLHVNNAHQIEGILVFVGAKHITHTITVVEHGFLNLLGNVASTHPSAVVTLVGVGIDEVDNVIR